MVDLKSYLIELVSKCEKIVPYASALHKQKSGDRIQVNPYQESIEPEESSQGLVINLWNGQSFFEYASNSSDLSFIEKEVLQYAKYTLTQINPALAKSEIDPGPKTQKDFINQTDFQEELSLQQKLNIAKERVKLAQGLDSQVVNVISIVGESKSSDIFVNRHKQMSQQIKRSDSILVVFVSDGKNTADIHGGLSKNGGFDKVQINDEEIKLWVEDAKKLLSAPRIKPGLYDVVTDPEWSGIIAHECFGHGMETDLYTRERALSQHYLGKPVASEIVNMFDDPSIIEEAGGFYFDDEGALSGPTHIIKNGILQRGLSDLASAHKLKITRSANGRRESFSRKAYARMTNTFFANGKTPKEEMIASVEQGIYLKHATNGMEDPQAWGIQVEGLWAQEIKNGKLTNNVYSPVIMTGFVPELLQSISMVGNDRFISGLGMCGKGHKEWVKNTTGGPHLKMKARLA
ncbi:MAG: TldD/PmbA family protein [Elusimicrobiota bacterium]